MWQQWNIKKKPDAASKRVRRRKKNHSHISWRWAKAKNPFFKLFVTLLLKSSSSFFAYYSHFVCLFIYIETRLKPAVNNFFFLHLYVFVAIACAFILRFIGFLSQFISRSGLNVLKKEKKNWFYRITSWNLLILWVFFFIRWNEIS